MRTVGPLVWGVTNRVKGWYQPTPVSSGLTWENTPSSLIGLGVANQVRAGTVICFA